MSNGKGSKPRPFAIPLDDYGQKYDDIFRKKDVEPKKAKKPKRQRR